MIYVPSLALRVWHLLRCLYESMISSVRLQMLSNAQPMSEQKQLLRRFLCMQKNYWPIDPSILQATLKSEMHISSVLSQTPSSVSGSGDNDGDEY